jgi:ATP:ADP antiporter, AAA family
MVPPAVYDAPSAPAARKSAVEKFLSLFTDVRPGEAATVLLMTLNVALLLAAYYVVKPVREALILVEPGGAEAKSYLSGVIALAMLLIVPMYAKLVNRFIRSRLISVVTVFFIACLVGFWALDRAGVERLGYLFYVWVAIFNVMIVAQFWAFANDVYDSGSGKRLFPIIAFGANVGAIAGPWITGKLIDVVGTFQLLLVCGGMLGLSILLTYVAARSAFGPHGESAPLPKARSSGPFEGLDMLFRFRYIGLIASLVLLLNLVNTTGEYIMGKVVAENMRAQAIESVRAEEGLPVGETLGPGEQSQPAVDAAAGRLIGRFYGDFFFWVNLLAAALQLFVTSRLVKYGGVRAGLLLLPLIALGTYGLVAFLPVLAFIRIGKIFENATDYSVNNAVRHMLFLPTAMEIKYKAKQATDSLMQRAGDFAHAIVVFVGTGLLALPLRSFAIFNLVIIALWIGIVLVLARDFRRLEAGELPDLQDPVPVEGAPAQSSSMST